MMSSLVRVLFPHCSYTPPSPPPEPCLRTPSGHGHPVWHGLRVLPPLQLTRAPRRWQYAGEKGSVSQGSKHDTFGAFSGHFCAIIGTQIAVGERARNPRDVWG